MSVPKIRFVVTTYTSVAEGGTHYHYAQVRSTVTGRVMFVQHVQTENSLTFRLLQIMKAFSAETAVYSVNVHMGRNAWRRANPTAAQWEMNLKPSDFLELEIEREIQL